jgi:Tol biopolymer transport system component
MKSYLFIITIVIFLHSCNSPEEFERNPNLIFLGGDLHSYIMPVWSPDGQTIFYLIYSECPKIGDCGYLKAVNVDGSNDRFIVEEPFGVLAVSPDGNRLAMTRDATTEEGGILILIDIDGANEETLTTSLPFVFDVKFFSNGLSLIYNGHGANDPDSNGFYTIDVNGLNEKFILEADRFHFDLSPNDSLIFYGNYTYSLADSSLKSYQVGGEWFRFHPVDPNLVILSDIRVRFLNDLYLLDLSSDKKTLLEARTYEKSSNLFASWSPDGSMIVFSSAESIEGDPSYYRNHELWMLMNISN